MARAGGMANAGGQSLARLLECKDINQPASSLKKRIHASRKESGFHVRSSMLVDRAAFLSF
jgi:hypothetical protein